MGRTTLGFLNPGGGPQQFVGGREISGDCCVFCLLDKVLGVRFFRHTFSVRRFDPFRNAAIVRPLRARAGNLDAHHVCGDRPAASSTVTSLRGFEASRR